MWHKLRNRYMSSYLRMNKHTQGGPANVPFRALTKNRANAVCPRQIADLPLATETNLSKENVMEYFITVN